MLTVITKNNSYCIRGHQLQGGHCSQCYHWGSHIGLLGGFHSCKEIHTKSASRFNEIYKETRLKTWLSIKGTNSPLTMQAGFRHFIVLHLPAVSADSAPHCPTSRSDSVAEPYVPHKKFVGGRTGKLLSSYWNHERSVKKMFRDKTALQQQ